MVMVRYGVNLVKKNKKKKKPTGRLRIPIPKPGHAHKDLSIYKRNPKHKKKP